MFLRKIYLSSCLNKTPGLRHLQTLLSIEFGTIQLSCVSCIATMLFWVLHEQLILRIVGQLAT